MRSATILIFLALAASSARGQAFPLFSSDAFASDDAGSRHLGVAMTEFGVPRSFRLETSLLPKQTRPLDPDAFDSLRFLGKAFVVVSAARPDRAQSTSASCSSPCTPVLPFQQPPIDADGILARCNNAGLWTLVVSSLHALSVQANQSR